VSEYSRSVASHRKVGRGLGTGRVGRPTQSERRQERAEPHAIAVEELDHLHDSLVPDERSVLAAKILEPEIVVDADAGMAAGIDP
jgi:hypothetical protein